MRLEKVFPSAIRLFWDFPNHSLVTGLEHISETLLHLQMFLHRQTVLQLLDKDLLASKNHTQISAASLRVHWETTNSEVEHNHVQTLQFLGMDDLGDLLCNVLSSQQTFCDLTAVAHTAAASNISEAPNRLFLNLSLINRILCKYFLPTTVPGGSRNSWCFLALKRNCYGLCMNTFF